MNLPPASASLERAANWSWWVLVCAAAVLAVLALLWYLRVIVLPVMVALTIAPALLRSRRGVRRRFERPAATLALLVGLAVVAGLIAIVTSSVIGDERLAAASGGAGLMSGSLMRREQRVIERLRVSLEKAHAGWVTGKGTLRMERSAFQSGAVRRGQPVEGLETSCVRRGSHDHEELVLFWKPLPSPSPRTRCLRGPNR